jgi:hypothetical protein
LENLNARLISLDPAAKLPARTAQIVLGDRVIGVGDLKIGDRFAIMDGKYKAIAEAKEIAKL